MQTRFLGLLIGLALGIALVFGGFFEMIVVGVFGVAGYLVARVLDGEIDINDYIGQGNRKRL